MQPVEILEQIAMEGLEALPELSRILINEALQPEREQHLGAGPYERSPERKGHANGYKLKQSKPVWAKFSSRCRKCVKDISTRKRWRKGFNVKEC